MTEKILPAIRHDDQMDKVLLKTIILQLKICTVKLKKINVNITNCPTNALV